MIDFAEWLAATSLSVSIQSSDWMIPFLQSVHILMIGLVFVSILMIALRTLGRVRTDQTLPEVANRFAPWMWTGIVVMAVTGVLLVIAEPVREFTALSFWLKMVLIAIGVAIAIKFQRSVRSAPSGELAIERSGALRSAAIATLALWVAIIFLGRAIAYDVEVWGRLSLGA